MFPHLQKKAGKGKTTKKVSHRSSTRHPTKKTHRLLTAAQFVINASQPASDKIFDVSAFTKFLQERIKVEGRVGNLGDTIVVRQQGEGKVEIIAHNELSGRYLKYLYVPSKFPSSSNLECDGGIWSLTFVGLQHQEVPQEEPAQGLAPRRLHLQGCLRAQVLQHR